MQVCKVHIWKKNRFFFFQYTFDLMVTNIHVYNVIGNREDCLVNTHHCRCSGVYHLDWRVLDQVNISILDIDLRICEIKLQDFMTSALFWNWCICLHFIFMWYLLKVEFTFFKHNTCINCRYEKKNEKSSFKWTALIFISRNIFFTSYGEEPF